MPVHNRKGHWHYAFCIEGIRYRGALPQARNKTQALRAEAEVKAQVLSGAYERRRKAITFREFVESKYAPVAKATTRNYTCNVGWQCGVLLDAFGARLLTDITHFEIEKWLLTLREKYSGVSINHFVRRLSTIFNHAIAAGYAHDNPTRMVRRVEEIPLVKRRLGREEEARLIEAAHFLGFDHTAAAVVILLETGMRPRELFEMKVSQVDLAQGIIRPVSYKIGRRRGGASAQPRERIVPLSDRARAEFEKLILAAIAAKSERVYPHRDIKKSYAAVCRQAGVEDFWLRWCRDEAASRWAEAGMDEFTIAKLLGHSSPKMSMVYVRDFRDRTVEKMNQAGLGNATNLPQQEGETRTLVLVNG